MHELYDRQRIHDKLVTIAYGHGYGTERPLTDDGKSACLRIAQMVMRGTSHFTPRQFGKPLGWDAKRSMRAIEELWHTHTIQRTITGDGDVAMSYDRVLNVVVTRAWDTDGNELVTYYISALESPFDWRGCPNGGL